MWSSNNPSDSSGGGGGEEEEPRKTAVMATTTTTAVVPQQADDNDEWLLYESPPQLQRIPTKYGLTAVHIYNANAAAAVSNHNKEGESTTTTTTSTVVLLHGFGGRKEEFRDGRLAQRLATKYRVIAFDWYGHGGSPDGRDDDNDDDSDNSKKKNKKKKEKNSCYCDYYKKESFLEQLQVLVTVLMKENDDANNNSSRNNNNNNSKFHLYAFSMGNFLALHYFRLFPDRVDRLVLHSPWNGEPGVFDPSNSILASAIRIPLGVGLAGAEVFRKTCFPHLHDAITFRKIFLSIGDGQKAWDQLLDDVADLIITTSSSSSSTAEDEKRVLIICGEAERPFFKLAKYIHQQFHKKNTLGRTTTTTESSSLARLISYPGANHTTWRDKWDKPAGRFFRNQIYDFLTAQQ